MFYQSDFQTHPVRFQPRFDFHKSSKALRKRQKKIIDVSSTEKDLNVVQVKEANVFFKLFYTFCHNTSVHGMKYLGLTTLHWSKR